METGEHEAKPTLEEVKQMILKHAALLVQEKGVYTGMRGNAQARSMVYHRISSFRKITGKSQ